MKNCWTALSFLRVHLKMPIELYELWRHGVVAPRTWLDVGCGNHAATRTLRWFPQCQYYGLDRTNYNNTSQDYAQMIRFYKADLENDTLEIIPNDYFDVVMMCQVLEHLNNGVSALDYLARKVAPGGYFYIEYPGRHSAGLLARIFPFMHFKTDPTHRRIYETKAIASFLEKRNLQIVASGLRLDWRKYFLLPLTIPLNAIYAIKRSPHLGQALWHVLPRSEFVLARRPAA